MKLMKNEFCSPELMKVFEKLEVGTITIDRDLNIVAHNRISTPFLGRLRDELLKCSVQNFFKDDVCENSILGKNCISFLSTDGQFRYLFFQTSFQEIYNDGLLKEGERYKRVLLDNINNSFLIIDKKGFVERAHFTGELSLVLGKRGFSDRLEKILNKDISGKILYKIEQMEDDHNRDMSYYRFEINGQVFWLDFYIGHIDSNHYFLNIDDKTGEHYLLERMDKLSGIEVSFIKVDEMSNKVSDLVSGILGYTEMALSKNEDPVVKEILDSIRKISSDSINLLKLMEDYTGRFSATDGGEGESDLREEDLVNRSVFVDVDRAIEYLEDNRELYITVISDFIEDYSDVSHQLPQLYITEIDAAHRLVHSIKGVSGIIGAYTLQSDADILEGYIRKHEWEQAEKMIPRFIATLNRVVVELKKIKDSGLVNETIKDREEINKISLDSHQKNLLRENLTLAEAGDYNGLIDNLNQYSSFEWGDDWLRVVHSLRKYVETIDFDSAQSVIKKLVY
jgi:HPt (histidine-containing phosphotransfer) domain-containing protein